MTRYIILRDKTRNWHCPTVPLGPASVPSDPAAPAIPSIETQDLSPADLRAASLDTSILGMAPVMPTRLVAPQPVDAHLDGDTIAGWGLDAVGARPHHEGGKTVRVAILDTGIDKTHACFQGVDITGKDFVGTGVGDANGHGTHVAGTLLGRDCDGARIGVARGISSLLVAKALPDTGFGTSNAFLESFLWAQTARVDIVCFSLCLDAAAHVENLTHAGNPSSLAMSAAVNAYRGNLRLFEKILQMTSADKAPLVLGPVGNDSRRMIASEFETGPSAPAAAHGVLAIGALGQEEEGLTPASFGNQSPILAAPGVGILSAAAGGGTRVLHGSTMAMAHVAGVAAIWLDKLRDKGELDSAQALADRLFSSATLVGFAPGLGRVDRGSGLIQAPPA